MDLEMKFLTAFYAIVGVVASAALIYVLATSAELAAFLVVVVAMFAVMGLMLATTLKGGDDGHGHTS